MTDVNMYKEAARLKLRFLSAVGDISTEQLYDLPLIGKSDAAVSLDNVAQRISRQLESLDKHSFVEVKPDPRRNVLELSLAIVKDVIADKLAAQAANEKRVASAAKRRKLLDALAAKEDQDLAGKSTDELLKELADIED